MMAVILTEWMDWYKRFAHWSLGTAVLWLAMAGACTLLCPELVLEVAVLGFIGLGLIAGMGIWLRVMPWDWVARLGLHPLSVTWARTTALLGIVAVHLMVIIPAWILMNACWGIPLSLVLPVAIIIAMATVIATLLASIGSYLNHSNGVFAGLFVFAWVALTAMVPGMRLLNPCWLMWRVLTPGTHGLLIRGAIAGLVFIIVLNFLFGFILIRERRVHLEDRGDASTFRA